MSQEFFKKYFLVNISDSKGLEASVIRIGLHWRTSSSALSQNKLNIDNEPSKEKKTVDCANYLNFKL